MKFDNKNAYKLQISIYLEESLGMVGRMMLEDIFNNIENMNEDETEAMVNAHYDNNIFELIMPYMKKALEEFELYKLTPEGKASFDEFKQVREELLAIEEVQEESNDDGNEGNGNVH
jgi:hypothetical protein